MFGCMYNSYQTISFQSKISIVVRLREISLFECASTCGNARGTRPYYLTLENYSISAH